MMVYAAGQIQRADSPDPAMTAWDVDLSAGRKGRVRVPSAVYDTVDATDRDAYVREALADHLTQRQVPEEDLLAGDYVATL